MISSAEEFVALLLSEDSNDRNRTKMDIAHDHVWLGIIEKYPEHVKWIAHNRTAPIYILEKLCEFGSDARFFLAIRRRLSPELFLRLSNDVEATVRQGVASNKKTPEEILLILANDIDPDVARVAQYNLQRK